MIPLPHVTLDDLRSSLPHSNVLPQRERRVAGALAATAEPAAAASMMAPASQHWRTYAAGVDAGDAGTTFDISRARVALSAGRASDALTDLDPARPARMLDALDRNIERFSALLALARPDEALDAAQLTLTSLSALPATNRPPHLKAAAREARGMAELASGQLQAGTANLRQALALRRAHDLDGSIHRARLERELVWRKPSPDPPASKRSKPT